MKRSARRKKSPRSGDGLRQAVVVIVLGSALGIGLYAAGDYVAARQRAPAFLAAMAEAKAAAGKTAPGAPGDDEVYTGSILYMPDEGQSCHQLLFDNLTGRFTDNGYVDCLHATYGSAGGTPMQMSAARVRVISNGFRH